jgi:hypothetical protein
MKDKLILLGVIIILATALFFGAKAMIRLNNKIDSLETTVLQSDSTNKVVLLSAKMFNRKLKSKLDTIEKRTGIKPKRINNVTHIHNHYESNDTTIYVTKEVSRGVFDISRPDNECWGFNGTFNIKTKQATITKKWAKNEIDIFGYTQRDKLFNNRWGPKWGKKRTYLGSISKCSGYKSEVTEYKIDKQ